jgi:hypothetical protein
MGEDITLPDAALHLSLTQKIRMLKLVLESLDPNIFTEDAARRMKS